MVDRYIISTQNIAEENRLLGPSEWIEGMHSLDSHSDNYFHLSNVMAAWVSQRGQVPSTEYGIQQALHDDKAALIRFLIGAGSAEISDSL